MSDNVIAHIREWVQEQTQDYDGSHDAEHARRVAENAIAIVGASRMNAIIAAWTHDVCDPKYVGDKEMALQRLSCKLRACGISSARTRHICNVVRRVSFTRLRLHGPPTDLTVAEMEDWRLVSDADMLEAMGMIGVIRTIMYQGHVQKRLQSALAYLDVLTSCKEHIHSSIATQEAHRRANVMRIIVRRMQCDPKWRRLAHFFWTQGRLRAKFSDGLSLAREKRWFPSEANFALDREDLWRESGAQRSRRSHARDQTSVLSAEYYTRA